MRRPRHFLIVVSDQHRADCLGCAGHAQVQTPHLDQLAAEGVRFTHAFTPSPICVPARSSFLAGQWPSRTGVVVNWDADGSRFLDPAGPTWARAIATGAGRAVDYVGRWHVHPQCDATHYGFDTHVPDGHYRQWRQSAGLPLLQLENPWWAAVDPHITPEQSQVAWLVDRAIERIGARLDAGEDFFLRLDCLAPHLPNRVPEPFASMYPPAQIEPWGSFGDTGAGKPSIQAQMRRTWGLEDWGWERWAREVALYLGEISLLDAQLGRLFGWLAERGVFDDTLVIYTSDHGDLTGAHGMIDKHYVMYDDVVRVPLLMRWPHGLPGGRVCDAFTPHLIDLAATLCLAAGVPVPAPFQGRDLLPLARGEAPPAGDDPPDDVFSTYSGNQFGLYTQRMVRDRRWKYVWNATAEDELYDLATDPDELRNRAAEPGCAPELARLRRRLVVWMERTGDRMLNAWTRPQLLEGRKR
jgi:arylsulfatase A-like enzyme